jgi:hypothetical protein
MLAIAAFAGDGDATTAKDYTNAAITFIEWGTSIIGTASIIAAITPTPKDDAVIRILKVAIDALALRFNTKKK